IDEAYDRSREILKFNSCETGFLAARGGGANYNAVWGRDGAICAVAAFVSDDEELIDIGVRTLLSLAEHQAANGQIPSYIEIGRGDQVTHVVHGGWGNVTAIDANLWFVIACQTAYDEIGRKEFIAENLVHVYRRAMRHLDSIDADTCGLLEIPVGGDWSDLLTRSYHVLYDQALWFRALLCESRLMSLAGDETEADTLKQRASLVQQRLNAEFWWDADGVARAAKRYLIASPLPHGRELPYYQSYLEPFEQFWYQRFDAFGNILACLVGIAPPHRVEQIIQQVRQRQMARPHPIRVLDPPVQAGDEDWIGIYHAKQKPYEYHNGAAWPLAGGLWAVLLAGTERHHEAARAMVDLARSLRLSSDGENNWEFHEYFHGKTGVPMGRAYQAWSAASYLLGYKAVHDERFACFQSPSRYAR
ncbi:MAG: glycoside hydrolase 100 family protein, partial [Phycisphaeraceae bacterium]